MLEEDVRRRGCKRIFERRMLEGEGVRGYLRGGS